MGKMSRTDNAKRNMLFGGVSKIVSIFIPFVIRTIVLWKLGAEYMGVSSLFSSILQVLNMAELGFSSAVVFGLYKPIADDDKLLVCSYLNFYRKVYRIIGIAILGIGILIIPILPYIIKGSYPDSINLYIVYLIFLFDTVLSYLGYAYKSVILSASQRYDLISKINTIISIFRCLLQFVSLLLFSNYYFYIICVPISTLIYNIMLNCITKKFYPEYVCNGKLSNQIISDMKKQIKGLAIGKVSLISRNSFDSIVISMYCGLVSLTMYSNYYYIFTSILGFISIIVQSINAGVGNTIATESKEKIYSDFKKVNFYLGWLGAWCTVCLYCLYQPFMKLWAGEDLMLPYSTMVLFCVYFYITQMGQARSVYASASGIWWEFRHQQVGEMFSNLILNFTLGYFFQIQGVIIATIITVFYFSIIKLGIKTFKYTFKASPIEYFANMTIYFVITIIVGLFTDYICKFVNEENITALFFKAIICCIVPNFIILAVVMINAEHRKYFFELIKRFKII